jgi:hypothetical protein
MHVVDHFLEKATSQISATQLESGNLELVQAFCLLSNLAQKRNKVNSGSVYLGIAVRMAIGLGLHRELPLWNISPFEREVRYVFFTSRPGSELMRETSSLVGDFHFRCWSSYHIWAADRKLRPVTSILS